MKDIHLTDEERAKATTSLVNKLWGMQRYMDQSIFNEPEVLANKDRMIQQIEDILTAIREKPETVATLVIFAGLNHEDGISTMGVITGNTPGIAACFMSLEHEGSKAMEAMSGPLTVAALMDGTIKAPTEQTH